MKAPSIYGLQYETIINNYPRLIFTKDNNWSKQDLNILETKMLLSYPIARLLSLELHEMDLQISLIYKLGSKKPLSQLMLESSLNEMDCFRILFTILTTLVDSHVHLLNEERYLIQPSFIYVGTDYLDVHLLYLPIADLSEKPPLLQELLKLFTELFHNQGRTPTRQVLDIMYLINSKDMQLPALKERILQAITDMTMPSQPATLLEVPLQETSLPPTNQKRSLLQRFRLPQTHNPHLITACIFSLILIWGYYLYFSSAGVFHLCLGLSLLILDLGYWLHRTLDILDTGELIHKEKPYSELQHYLPLSPPTDYYEQLGHQTTLLAPITKHSDATVLLPRPWKAYLELTLGEETELIQLSSDSFVIGRNEEVAQFTANWLGLSRSHIMFTRQGNQFEVKDLGSKNGSFLNEEAMVPHQTYSLNEGDCIKIVEKQLIYKIL